MKYHKWGTTVLTLSLSLSILCYHETDMYSEDPREKGKTNSELKEN
jgi:hypothetical protein